MIGLVSGHISGEVSRTSSSPTWTQRSTTRRLTRNSADEKDVVQEAFERAFRFFTSVRSDNVRSWLFTIVRRTWYARVAKPGNRIPSIEYDELTDRRSAQVLQVEELLIRREQGRVRARCCRTAAGRLS